MCEYVSGRRPMLSPQNSLRLFSLTTAAATSIAKTFSTTFKTARTMVITVVSARTSGARGPISAKTLRDLKFSLKTTGIAIRDVTAFSERASASGVAVDPIDFGQQPVPAVVKVGWSFAVGCWTHDVYM